MGCLYKGTYAHKYLLKTHDILSRFKITGTAINYLYVDAVIKHINAIT